MTGNGWKELMSQAEAGGRSMLAYQKAGRTATMVVEPSGKATQISMTVIKGDNDTEAAAGE